MTWNTRLRQWHWHSGLSPPNGSYAAPRQIYWGLIGIHCPNPYISLSVCLSVCLSLSDMGFFPPIGGFPPIERSHGSFLRSVQIRWENYRVYLTCERFSESNFANLPHASISFLHGTFSNGVNLFCFGHHHSVHGLAESTTKGSNPIVTCKSAVYGL